MTCAQRVVRRSWLTLFWLLILAALVSAFFSWVLIFVFLGAAYVLWMSMVLLRILLEVRHADD